MESYRGQIYVDVPFDKRVEAYRKLEALLEHPDGSMKLPDVTFHALSLDAARKNAHHDEPGFWDSWPEKW